jgi:hypothetical protein
MGQGQALFHKKATAQIFQGVGLMLSFEYSLHKGSGVRGAPRPLPPDPLLFAGDTPDPDLPGKGSWACLRSTGTTS